MEYYDNIRSLWADPHYLLILQHERLRRKLWGIELLWAVRGLSQTPGKPFPDSSQIFP